MSTISYNDFISSVNKEDFIRFNESHENKATLEYFNITRATYDKVRQYWQIPDKRQILSTFLATHDRQEFIDYYFANGFSATTKHFNISDSLLVRVKRAWQISNVPTALTNILTNYTEAFITDYFYNHSQKEFLQYFNIDTGTLQRLREKLNLAPKSAAQREAVCTRIYGVKNISSLLEVQLKVRATNKTRYGVEFISQSPIIREKATATHEKHKKEMSSIDLAEKAATRLAKYQQTCLKLYGVDNYAKTDEFREKTVATCRKLYGVENYSQTETFSEQVKQTCQEKYGVDHFTQLADFQTRRKEACIAKRGVPNNMQDPICIEKSFNTKNRRQSYNTSKDEAKFYDRLLNYFAQDDILRWHKDNERYPFACDFYIRSLDLFIEINFYWGHGKHPFDPKSETDTARAAYMKLRSAESRNYRNALDVWTHRDVEKQNYAKNNKLNYIMLYNNKEVNSFFNNIDKIKKGVFNNYDT